MSSWIKLHRKMLKWGWYKDPAVKIVWLHLLLTVNREETEFKGHKIKPGAGVYGRRELAGASGLTEKQVRRALECLEKGQQIGIQRTNKFSIISIIKWSEYQANGQQGGQQRANRGPAEGQQRATVQEEENIRRGEGESNLGRDDQPPPSEPDPIQIAFEDWSDLASKYTLPTPRKITDARRRAMKARLDEDGLDGWRLMLSKVAASKFLTGQNASGWVADIDFVLKLSNFNKIMEGKYDDRTGSVGNAKHPMAQAFDQLRERVGGYGASGNPFFEEPADAERGTVIELEAIGRRYPG